MRPCSPTARSPSVLTSPVISPSKRMLVLECRRPSSLISLLSTVSADTGTDLRLGLGSNTDGPPVGCDTLVTVPTPETAAPANSCPPFSSPLGGGQGGGGGLYRMKKDPMMSTANMAADRKSGGEGE